MQQAFYQLSDYHKYLEHAIAWMWSPARIEKVTWENDRLHNESSKPAEYPDSIWLTLREPENSGEADAVQNFCDADFVAEGPYRYAPRIRVLDADYNTGSLRLERKPAGEERILYLPPNEYALRQQSRSLQRLQNNPDPEHRGLLRLVENSSWVEWPGIYTSRVVNWEFLNDPSIPGTDEQRKFVEIALGTPDFAILEGPPGSGKTTTICELIIQEIQRGHRVLLCASTHVAVDNVLESLQKHGSTDKEVIAVRIGDKSRLSDEVKEFQLQERVRKEQKDLIQKLSKVSHRSGSQEHLLAALQTSGDSVISRIILQSANLVCGTTLGILQHPDVKEQIKQKDARKPAKYDCLILDEASKTTFQEFLVPALFAYRWILVGDVRQLSPYVETRDVEANIRALVTEDDAKVCARVFRCWDDSQVSTRGLLVIQDQPYIPYVQQAESLGLNGLYLRSQDAQPNPLDFLSSHIIVTDKKMSSIEPMIPPDMEVIVNDSAIPLRLQNRHDYWKWHFARSSGVRQYGDEEPEWAREIAWRLSRTFELRNDPANAKKLQKEIELLLPHWYDPKEQDRIADDLDIIKRVSLPSMLELLQTGFQRRERDRTGSSLTDGIRPTTFEPRHVKLSYQHRMHPDISKFPREKIYESGSLKDPDDMAQRREWSYRQYTSRAGWMLVRGIRGDATYPNIAEIENVIAELQTFLRWASKNPKASGDERRRPWEVAILTFYRRQESELRRRLRWFFDQPGKRTVFSSPDASVTVRLCTVDRFQGHEADIVFLSFVRVRGLGFLDSPFRLNVALTRARYQLVLVGSQQMFASQTRSQLLQELASLPRFGISLNNTRENIANGRTL